MSREQLQQELVKFLQDAHAMEQQSLQTLQAAVKVAGDPRLETHDESRSLVKDLAGRAAATGLGAGLVSGSDTPARLLAVAYGFEHFEIAMYQLLKRVAKQAGDDDAGEMADKILVNERQAAEKLEASYDLALERSLRGAVKA